MLSLVNVSVFYGHLLALNGICLDVNQGEIIALIGSNGAGKTSTLMTISGLIKPPEGIVVGDVLYKGQKLNKFRGDQIVKLGIGQVPERRGIFARMTVEENLRLGAFLLKDAVLLESRKQRVFDLFPILKDRQKQLAGTLSGGEQQMLAIGRALMMQPQLLLLDEPSLGLAPKIVSQLFHRIQRINAEGVTILLVEQNARKALEIAHRGYVLEVGQIVKEGNAKDLLKDTQVQRAYLGGSSNKIH